jgi:hypothetical protein
MYMVPDKFWEFEAAGRTGHPGACLFASLEQRQATLVKGTDADGVDANDRDLVIVLPSRTNGLYKPTAFELVPRLFRLQRILLLHHNRKIGELDPLDLDLLRRELARVFGAK